MSSLITLKAGGLQISPNPLDLPPGSLDVAENIIIRRDNVIESRRGFSLYGEDFGSSSDRAKQLINYKNRILFHYSNILNFDTGTTTYSGLEIFSPFAGAVVEAQTGLRIKSIESNGNLYFTTSNGIQKISAQTAADFTTSSGFITKSGGVKALDQTATVEVTNGDQSSWFLSDSAVAYRVVWGTIDRNNNLVLGTPSQRSEVYNPLLSLIINDLMQVLQGIESVAEAGGSAFTVGTYMNVFKLPITASALQVYTNLVSMCSLLDTDTSSVTYSTIAVGHTAPNTPATNTELLDLQEFLDEIITALQAEGIGVIPAQSMTDFITPLDITTTANVKLVITIPEDITTSYFLQIYRSDMAIATGASVLLTDVFPDDEMKQVYEAYPTAAELSAGIMTVIDVTPNVFRGANLYTNPITGVGINGANDIPPFALDINRFKNVTFYANTRTRQRADLNLLGVLEMLNDYGNNITPTLTMTDGELTNTYSFIEGVSQVTSVVTVADVANSLDGKYWLINSANDVNEYYIWYSSNSAPDPTIPGRIGIKVVINTGDSATVVAERTRDVIASYVFDFNTSSSTNTVTITNTNQGTSLDAVDGDTGFTIITSTQGAGERIAQELTEITCVADVAGSLAGTYFTINSTYNLVQNYIWFKVSGVGSDPAIAGKIGIQVDLITNDSAPTVATKINAELSGNEDYNSSVNSNILTITNIRFGPAANATAGTSGFTIDIIQNGALDVLLSSNASPAQAVSETAISLLHVMNLNRTENLYGYYLSGAQDVPGKILLEARDLSTETIYIVANNENTGFSFSPDLSPTAEITSISAASSSVITTAAPHGFTNKQSVVIGASDSVPSIDGVYEITYLSSTTFSIPIEVTNAGSYGSAIAASDAQSTTDEALPNRIYYSQFQQPEAVPILNTIDVGATDKAILRIFPLRDSLFVFKEDGLFRISGEQAPFVLDLFDSSCIVIPPDSVSVSNNVIYGWTKQGISAITEAGVLPSVSRPIDTDILRIATSDFTNFGTATWGVGYESDNAYYVFTTKSPADTEATICYRYSNLTNTWTTFDKTDTCGVVNTFNDKLYLGAGDSNNLEQERKSFTRYDYADEEISTTLNMSSYTNSVMKLNSVEGMKIGDVLVQVQSMTVFNFNSLLHKLDLDPGVDDSDYYDLLNISMGDDPRTALVALANKLDADPGVNQSNFLSSIDSISDTITGISTDNPSVITCVGHGLITGRIISITGSNSVSTINNMYEVTVIDANTFTIDTTVETAGTSGSFTTQDSDFNDLMACFNEIVTLLNANTNISFHNYVMITSMTTIETPITNVNATTREITILDQINFIVGSMSVFEAIRSKFQYSPVTMGDSLGLKHLREATVMYSNKAFTKALLEIASDLLPEFLPIPIPGDGNGIFGMGLFGAGFFGGNSNGAPFRTYIPRDKQRCRYLLIRHTHRIAREKYSVYGLSVTGEISQSSRAYR